MELFITVLVGIGLSATAGIRIFLPFLVLSAAAMTGHLELSPRFEWIGSHPAFTVFLVATILEVLAYLFPLVDNLLGVAAAPAAALAGVIITASVIVDMDPLVAWSLAIIAGGGASLTTKTASSLLHAGSTGVSGGTANPILSALETAVSAVMAVVSVLLPLLVIAIVGLAVFFAVKFIRRRKQRKPGWVRIG